MKKFITLAAAVALASIVFGMAKAPADAKACGAEKACVVKEAASCPTTEAAACKTEAEACATKEASACAVKDAAACEIKEAACAKTAEEAAGCAGGTCPLTK